MSSFTSSSNPLESTSLRVWDELIEAVGPASLLVLIDRKMSQSLKAHHSAEDIFQEALLHAWRDRHQCQWRGLRQFRAWLISIIDHRIHDAADMAGATKRGGASPPHLPIESCESGNPGAMPMDSTTPSRIAIYREQATVIHQALASLPAELIEVVRLRLFEQLPMDSIAAHLNIGVAAVRHRFRKGVELYHRRLRAAMLSRSGAALGEDSAPLTQESSSSTD